MLPLNFDVSAAVQVKQNLIVYPWEVAYRSEFPSPPSRRSGMSGKDGGS